MKNKCDNYTETSDCLTTFDGKCSKEHCFTYRLLQENKHLNDLYNQALKDYDVAISKLEKIQKICKNVMSTGIDEETDKFDDILQIIDEAEWL